MNPLRSRNLSSLLLALSIPCLGAASVSAQAATPDMLVSSRFSNEILRFDGSTGAALGVFADGGNLANPVGLTYGPDGNLYVSSAQNDRILRYDGSDGSFIDIFASGGILDDPRQLNFGPDGHLYVANAATNQILRFDGQDGDFIDIFATGGQLSGPTSFSFAPNGNLYVVSVSTARIKIYQGQSGAFLGNFPPATQPTPHDLSFGPDGNLYIVSATRTRIKRYNPITETFIDNFVFDGALTSALGIQWDGAGNLYVVNQGADEVRRYDALTGDFESVVITKGASSLDSPLFMTFMPPSGGPQIEAALPGVAGQTNHIRVSGFEAGRKLILFMGTPMPTSLILPCGLQVGLSSAVRLSTMSADESGAGILGGFVPLDLAGVTLNLQAFSVLACTSTPVRAVTF